MLRRRSDARRDLRAKLAGGGVALREALGDGAQQAFVGFQTSDLEPIQTLGAHAAPVTFDRSALRVRHRWSPVYDRSYSR
ncbi:MAG TPA: hypothetical protein VFC47_09945 [Caulobacteraceae bacterium]|nr:hypothetical protein [Caulobacteraceae bacterium]